MEIEVMIIFRGSIFSRCNHILINMIFPLLVLAMPRYASEPIFLTDYSNTFVSSFELNNSERLVLERKEIAAPQYDGGSGSDEIIASITKFPENSTKTLLHLKTVSSVRLFAFAPAETAFYAFELAQRGATQKISKVLRFSPRELKGKMIGKPGSYQYGIPTPDIKYCLVVDSSIHSFELKTGKVTRVDIGAVNLKNLAEPESPRGVVRGNYNLTGDYMEIVWTGKYSGEMLVKSDRQEIRKRIEFKIR